MSYVLYHEDLKAKPCCVL